MKTNINKDRFRILHNGIMPQQGYVLISEPFLSDTYFQRSVIYLSDFNEDNTMGFVLNKQTGIVLGDLFTELKYSENLPIFLGGPVGSDKLFFLHTLGDIIPDALSIGNSIYMNGDFDVLRNYINQGNPIDGKIKFFLGYSGWGSGQLEEEIKSNTWLVSNIDTNDIIAGDGDDLWKKSLSKLDKCYKMWINYPKEPYLN